MTPEESAKRALREAYTGNLPQTLAPDALENLEQAIAAAIRDAVAEEREKNEMSAPWWARRSGAPRQAIRVKRKGG